MIGEVTGAILTRKSILSERKTRKELSVKTLVYMQATCRIEMIEVRGNQIYSVRFLVCQGGKCPLTNQNRRASHNCEGADGKHSNWNLLKAPSEVSIARRPLTGVSKSEVCLLS